MTKSQVLQHDRYTGVLWGPERPRLRILPELYAGNTRKVCLVKFASNSSHYGFCQIKSPKFGSVDSDDFDVFADAIILTQPETAVVAQTADCLTAIAYERVMNRTAVIHCGRPAMTPQNLPGEPIKNIITLAYQALTFGILNPEVDVNLTGGICGDCFLHDRPEAKNLIEPFDQFGKLAFNNREKGALNIPRIAIHQFMKLGVKLSDIRHDGLCTKESHWLTSYRDNPVPRNAVVVVHH